MRVATLLMLALTISAAAASSGYNNCKVGVVGAGPAGVYTAWRLATDPRSSVEADEICIFEAQDRVGGRIRPITADDYPELNVLQPGQHLEMGGYRYHTSQTPMTRAIIEDVLELPHRCYDFADFQADNVTCPPGTDPAPAFWYARGKVITPSMLGNSDNFPFELAESDKWGPGRARSSKPSPMAFMGQAFPQIPANAAGLTSPDEATRWATYKTVISSIQNHLIYGNINPSNMDLRTLVGDAFSNEFYALDGMMFGNGGLSGMVYSGAMYQQAVSSIKNTVLGAGTHHMIRGYSYREWVDRLLQRSMDAGVRIFFNHELSGLFKSGSKYRMEFSNGVDVKVEDVVLALHRPGLLRLNRQSIIFQESTEQFKTSVGALYESENGKVYLYYDDAWWINELAGKPGITVGSGTIGTTEFVKEFRYHDAPHQYNPATGRYSGFILASYIIGRGQMESQQFDNDQKLDGELEHIMKMSDPSDARRLMQTHNALMRAHAHLLNTSTITPPRFGVAVNWNAHTFWRSGAQVMPSDNFTPGQGIKSMLRPIPDERVFMANLDYGGIGGWAETSILMGEKLAHRFFNCRPVPWMSAAWYDANINFDE